MTLSGRWSAVAALLLLAFLFTGLALLQLSLVRGEAVSPATLLPLGVLMACSGGAVFLARRRLTETILLPVTFFLSGFGLVLIASFARKEIDIKETLVLATILAAGSYVVFVWALSLQFPVWPSFIVG